MALDKIVDPSKAQVANLDRNALPVKPSVQKSYNLQPEVFKAIGQLGQIGYTINSHPEVYIELEKCDCWISATRCCGARPYDPDETGR